MSLVIFCMCMVLLCVCGVVCVCARMWRPEVEIRLLNYALPQDLWLNLELPDLASLAGQQNPGFLLVFVSPVLGLPDPTTTPAFHVCGRDSNSGPYSCAVST